MMEEWDWEAGAVAFTEACVCTTLVRGPSRAARVRLAAAQVSYRGDRVAMAGICYR